MITLTIIFVVIVIILSTRKDKHNRAADWGKIMSIPSFTIYARPMSSTSKILNMAWAPSNILQTFCFDRGNVTIITESGKRIIAPLGALFVDFQDIKGMITYDVYYQGTKLSFYQTTNITKEEWHRISQVLCLAGQTRGMAIFGKAYNRTKKLNMFVKVINHLFN